MNKLRALNFLLQIALHAMQDNHETRFNPMRTP